MEIVLVHGLAGSSRWWREVTEALPEPVRVVDVRAHDPVAWLERELEGARDLVLVGHSLGGLACTAVAARRPERVRALVLVGPVGVPTGRSIVSSVLPLVRVLRYARPSFFPMLVADALRAGPVAVLRGAQLALASDLRRELARLELPVLLVWGEHDRLAPPALADEWLAALPDGRLVTIAGAAHVPMLERPDAFREALLGFLAEVQEERA